MVTAWHVQVAGLALLAWAIWQHGCRCAACWAAVTWCAWTFTRLITPPPRPAG